jgi:DNA-binding protein H-NS
MHRFTVEEKVELVREYLRQPYGTKGKWLTDRHLPVKEFRAWRSAFLQGALPYGTTAVRAMLNDVMEASITTLEDQMSSERAEHARRTAILEKRISRLEQELEGRDRVIEALGKAIGTLQERGEHGSDEAPTTPPRASSSSARTPSSPASQG